MPVIGRSAARRRRAMLAGVALAAVAVAPASEAKPPKQPPKPIKGPTIKVADDFFAPTSVQIKENTKLTFKWDGANLNTHNVLLEKGPKGVRRKDFESAPGTIRVKFAPIFEKRGTYDLVCTFHPDVMTMRVNVKKGSGSRR